MMKKLAMALLIVAVLAGLAWLVMVKVVGAGKVRAEAWVAAQLTAIADDHLNPTLRFSKLVYTFPKTATLSGVSLTDHGVSIITADSITIELARLPKRGEPIVLQIAEFQAPVVRLIERSDGSLQGLTNLVKTDGGRVHDDGGSTRLSDVLAMTRIRIVDGSLSYEPQGRPPMVLQPLTFEMHHARPKPGAATDRPSDAGWYGYEASLMLQPVVTLDNKARLNLNNGDLDVESLTLDMSLDQTRYRVFTPSIQEFLKAHEILGTLHGTMSGLIGLDDLARTSLKWHVKMTEASAVVKGHKIPVQSLDLDGSYIKSVLDFPKIDANAFGGQLNVKARFDYAGHGDPFEVHLEGKDLRLEDMMEYQGKPDADFTGDTTMTVTASGQMENLGDTLTGSGRIDITNARMVILALFRREMNKEGEHKPTDRAQLEFELFGDRAHVSREIFLGKLIGISGSGDTYYDGRLNHIVKAGPAERLAGEFKGAVGELLEVVPGALVKYQVTGTLKDVNVRVLPFGLGQESEKELEKKE